MRILLVGEYSRLHNSLKEGLATLGHDVTIVGNGDGFKNFPVDVKIDAVICKSVFVNPFRQAIFRIFKYDIAEVEYGIRFWRMLPHLKNFDVVQLVSETPLFAPLRMEYFLLAKLRRQNKKMFALCSGTDALFMQAAHDGKFRYSLLDPYRKDRSVAGEYIFALPLLTPAHKRHHLKMQRLIDGMIATDIDYAIALEGEQKSLGMVPNPVNTDTILFEPNKAVGKIVIFHGINRWNYHKKGNVFFEKALEIIKNRYPERIEILTSENLPYAQYRALYDRANIVLDQVYAYDQGYNALEAMARGKVVFTGAEKEFMEYYGLTDRVAVNALPDVDSIVAEFVNLIENPHEIEAIGKRARGFVEKEHDYKKIAKKYLSVWQEAPF